MIYTGNRRTRKDAGWVDPALLPKGPNGRNLCRFCQQEVPRGRLTFCGNACVNDWKIQTQPGYVAHKLFERDKGICATCGTDTVAKRKQAEQEYHNEPYRYMKKELNDWWWIVEEWPRTFSRRWWEMDHIYPVQHGGGCCGLDNLQTLCVPCHKKKTSGQVSKKRIEAARLPLFGEEEKL